MARFKIAVTLAALFTLGAAASGPAAEASAYLSAVICGECHAETFESWSRSIHALAAIDPIFSEAVARAERLSGSGARRLCLSCHSPTTLRTGDYDLEQPVSKEGVTCSFCHSVTGIDLDAGGSRFVNDPERLRIDPGGAIADHHIEDNSVMMGAEFCAGCHEWKNPLGLKILSTYSEWKESSYAGEKITCQQCHMPESLGGETDTEGAKSLRTTNVHFQMGGHSQDQLVVAAELSFDSKVAADSVTVEVDITNRKAGHRLPTGIPSRKMRLIVELFDRDGLQLHRRTATYSRVIVDAGGKVLKDVADQFLQGARVLSDNRIAPKEKRRERFVFPRPENIDFLLIETSLEYEILTPFVDPPVLSFDVEKKRAAVDLSAAGRPAETTPIAALAVIAVVFVTVTAAMILILRRRQGSLNSADRKE